MVPLYVPINWYLVLSAALFAVGMLGVLTRRSALIIFMSVELMLNAANLSFAAFSRLFAQVDGQIFVFFGMSVAAAEVAVGLAILIALFRNKETTDIASINILKW
jgi:NADH-quinone oxidoreductase subunit K